MTGKWITGKELMNCYNIMPAELGEICSLQGLTAYSRELLTPLSDGQYIPSEDFPLMGTKLHFRFKDFEYSNYSLALPPRHTFACYSEMLEDLLFLQVDVERVFAKKNDNLLAITPPQTANQLTPMNVPASLWAGKRTDIIIENLKSTGFDEDTTIYILVQKCEKAKTEIGRLFYPDVMEKGNEKENSSYIRRVDTAIKKIEGKYTLTFDG